MDHSLNRTYHTVYTEIYSIEKVFKTKIREEKANKQKQQNNPTHSIKSWTNDVEKWKIAPQNN